MRQTNSPSADVEVDVAQRGDGVAPRPNVLCTPRSEIARHSPLDLRLAALGEDLVEQRQVVDAGVGEVDRRRAGRPRSASSAEPCSDEAIGSSVNSRCSQAPAIVSSARRLVVTFSMPSLTICWAAAASPLASSIASPSPLMRSRTTSGCSSRNAGGDDQVGRDELPVRPQLGLVDEHVAAALATSRVAHGSGTQAPSTLPAWNAGQRVGVVLRA